MARITANGPSPKTDTKNNTQINESPPPHDIQHPPQPEVNGKIRGSILRIPKTPSGIEIRLDTGPVGKRLKGKMQVMLSMQHDASRAYAD